METDFEYDGEQYTVKYDCNDYDASNVQLFKGEQEIDQYEIDYMWDAISAAIRDAEQEALGNYIDSLVYDARVG